MAYGKTWTWLLLAVAIAALCPLEVSAQATNQKGSGVDDMSSLLVVDSTTPKVTKCTRIVPGCLRVMFAIKPRGTQNIQVSYFGSGFLQEAPTFVGTGAACELKPISGLEGTYGDAWGHIDFRDSNFTVVTPSKPALLVVEMECDQKILPGDQMTYQITLVVRTDPRTGGKARYVFSQIDVN